jgi:hypothetical protein
VPACTPTYYFEVEILSAPQELDMQVSYTYYSDQKSQSVQNWGWSTGGNRAPLYPTAEKDLVEYQKSYGQGDVIGCAFDFESEVIYYTRNGERLRESPYILLTSLPLPLKNYR